VSFSQRKTNRVWKPNLQNKHLEINGVKTKIRICTQCLRTLKKPEKSTKQTQPA
jgi:large subunit ribosomal protein L28